MNDVPYGYLIGTVVIAVACAFALWPYLRPRPRLLWTASYFLGLTLNELPVWAFGFLLGSTALALAEGDVAGPGGLAVLVLAVVTMIGLARVFRRALTAEPVLRQAVSDGLGPDVTWPRRPSPVLRSLLGPLVLRPRNVVRVANLAYGPAGRRNLLDVLHRRDSPQGAPVLVFWHGGGYRSGAKYREARPMLHRLAQQGWVCITANYRLRPRHGFGEHLADARAAIAWAQAHAAEFGGDPATVVVSGASAGGHLAAICGLSAPRSVAAVVDLYGWHGSYFDDPAAGSGTSGAPASSPLAYVGPDAPPFFTVACELDALVPIEDARALVDALRRTSRQPVVYAELPGAHHAFDVFHSIRSEALTDAVEAFLTTAVLTPRDRTPGATGSTR